ncbi:MAG: HlyD family efflux transporter periplasmic adaptor subunit [Chlamydiales bacterium]|nr:HlyD family efflux transporter periplasmic adaptor subunit [Chlamydiia bacterium]MCP5507695.1 HlyD family efflux transporter periplasmic adaptor subunit [Chlamydiales bacterium]
MTASQSSSTQSNPALLQHLAVINKLCLKAYSSKKRTSLIFTILNDTIHALRYDRAVLFDMEKKKPQVLGVSGHHEANKNAAQTKQWEAIVKGIADPKKPQVVTQDSMIEGRNDFRQLQQKTKGATLLWLPIIADGDLLLGLWLEIWDTTAEEETVEETLKFVTNFLTPAYGAAWLRLNPRFSLKRLKLGRQQIYIGLTGLLIFLFFVQVPVRVVAPCEIVANDPYLITAPLNGVIDHVAVDPGQYVQKGEVLLEYDKELPLQNLKIAQKQVEILEAEMKRARALGMKDPKSRTEIGVLALKLQKEQINLDLAKWQAGKLALKAPIEGVVMLDNPDAWRGKPVQIGEKIMSINDPGATKVRIWIPEDDNVVLDPSVPIKIFLNINPEVSRKATITYVANESTISAQHLPSFVAEANWVDKPDDIKLGLKGTAILYGEKVSLFYFIVRKPWAWVRHKFGI